MKEHQGRKRPFILINMAMTADGKIATANRAVSKFGSARDQRHMLDLRATVDAVMAGARTVDSDAVTMGPGGSLHRKRRLKRGLAEYNLRIVVSRSASLNPDAEIFKHTFSPIIVLTTGAANPEKRAALQEVAEVRVCGEREIDWASTLRWLRDAHHVERLLCEGGGELNDDLIRGGFVDELHLTVCPVVFGGREAPTISDGEGFSYLADAARLQCTSMKKAGGEMFFSFRVR